MNSVVTDTISANDVQETDSLLRAFSILLQVQQLVVDPTQLDAFARSEHAQSPKKAIRDFCNKLDGIKPVFKSRQSSGSLQLPLIVHDRSGEWFVVAQKTADKYLIQRPDHPSPELLDEADFEELFDGQTVSLRSGLSKRLVSKFDIRWFIPELLKWISSDQI